MKRFVQWLLNPAVIGTLGMLVLSALLWWVGPLVSIGSVAPLGPLWVRLLLLVLLWLVWIGYLAYGAWKRRRTNAVLLAGLSGGPTASTRKRRCWRPVSTMPCSA